MTALLRTPRQHVEPRLLAALDRAAARPLVSLLGAHGSGKSVLLEQWADERDVPVLVATDADRDPHQLMTRLVTALTHGRGGTTPPDLGAAVDATAPIDVLVDRIVAAAQDPPTRVAIDEVDRLAGSTALELLRALCAVPGSKVRLVVASRVEMGLLDDRVRSRGAGTTIDARALALRPAEIEGRLVRAIERAVGTPAPPGETTVGGVSRASVRAWAQAVATATSGWAAGADAVMDVLVDAIAADDDGAARGGDVGGGGGVGALGAASAPDVAVILRSPAVSASVDAFLLREEQPAARHLVAEVALLDVTDARELAAVQQRSEQTVRAELDDLLRRGLIQPGPGRPGYLDVGTVTVSPLVRVALLERLAAADGPEPDALTEVLDGLERAGQLGRVLTVLVEVGAQELAARMLTTHGARLLGDGQARAVARAAASIGESLRDPGLERLHGDALALLGDDEGALARLAAAGQPDDLTSVLPRVRLLVQRGELSQALELGTPLLPTGRTAAPDTVIGPGDDPTTAATHTALAAWLAVAHLRRGELGPATDTLDLAMAAIDADEARSGREDDDGHIRPAVVALVRIVAAELAAVSEATDEVYELAHRRAFAAAEQADDPRLVAQVRIDRARHHLDVGRTTEALFELDRAQGVLPTHGVVVEASEVRALRAEVLLRTGRIDAAAVVADDSRRIDERRHARTSARGWYLLGDVHRQRGALAPARDAYERALAVAGDAGDQRPVAAASIGLARVLARTDVSAARRAVEAVLAQPTPVTGAVLAAGWLALAAGDVQVARTRAQEADRRAGPRHDERALAEAATLLALLDEDPVPALRRAARTWHRLHDPLWAARTELGIARRAHDLDERSRIGDLELRLARLGASIHQGEVAHELVTGLAVPAPVAIGVLGGFAIHHGGTRVDAGPGADTGDAGPPVSPAPHAARIVQLLALRRGRSVAREELLAWLGLAPDDDQRLAAAVALARGLVTSADGRAVALSGTATAFTLRTAGIDLDLDVFERRALAGLRAQEEGRAREAKMLLLAAAAADGGPLLAGEDRTNAVARVLGPIEARIDVLRGRIEAGLRATEVSLGSIEHDADQGDPR